MRRTIRADIIRIQRKKSLLITSFLVISFILLAGIIAGLGVIKGDKNENFSTFVTAAIAFCPFMTGIPIFTSVFSDDFKSHSMQVSIGRGFSRNKLVYARFFETLIMVAEAFVVFSLFIIGLAVIFGINSKGMMGPIKNLWMSYPNIVCYFAVSMIFVFLTQSGTLGLVVYILLAASITDMILNLLKMVPFIRDMKHDITNITIDGMIGCVYSSEREIWKRCVYGVAVLVIYIIIPIIASKKIFKHKELEF